MYSEGSLEKMNLTLNNFQDLLKTLPPYNINCISELEMRALTDRAWSIIFAATGEYASYYCTILILISRSTSPLDKLERSCSFLPKRNRLHVDKILTDYVGNQMDALFPRRPPRGQGLRRLEGSQRHFSKMITYLAGNRRSKQVHTHLP